MRHKCCTCHGSGLVKQDHGGTIDCVECAECWGRGSIEFNRGYIAAWLLLLVASLVLAIVGT